MIQITPAELQQKKAINVVSAGLNMKGQKVIVKGILTFEGDNIILTTQGCRILLQDLTGIYRDIAGYRKLLKATL